MVAKVKSSGSATSGMRMAITLILCLAMELCRDFVRERNPKEHWCPFSAGVLGTQNTCTRTGVHLPFCPSPLITLY